MYGILVEVNPENTGRYSQYSSPSGQILQPTAKSGFINKKIKTQKKLILFLLVAATLSSCAFENYQCPAYGSNGPTKHGLKAQKSYSKRRL
ncbi:MAG: hypothetical protein IM618_04090 [Cytophagales bacterium]|jgi:hypothetical protein|nr:hypothetical protein [Cytophagales bacterium]